MNSRRKGARGELLWRDELRARGYTARRGQQFSGSPDSPDVVCRELASFFFEVKTTERLNLEEAMNQARRDCGTRTPILVHKKNRRGWLVTIDARTFFQLVGGMSPPESTKQQTQKLDKPMKIKGNDNNFQPCPEYSGRATCIDVTPLTRQVSQYGERNTFRVVFEVDIPRADGGRFCAWSRHFTASLNDKSAFRKFLCGWFGRDLTQTELREFDTEKLVGMPAELVIVHQFKDGVTFSNIAACMPFKSGEPLVPCGRYIRIKDRPAPASSEYRRAEQPATGAVIDHAAITVHTGRCRGLQLGDLSDNQVKALVDNWLPTARENTKPTADDKRLIVALDWWLSRQSAEDDNVAY